MFIKVLSAYILGVDSIETSVEVSVSSRGLPYFNIIGIPGRYAEEIRQRVKTAFINSGIKFPEKRITVSIGSCDGIRAYSCFDLPIATAILCYILGVLPPEKSLFYGELALDGTLHDTKGVFSVALFGKDRGVKCLFIPSSGVYSTYFKDILYPIDSLNTLKACFLNNNFKYLKKFLRFDAQNCVIQEDALEIPNIIGQESAKRALQISIAGGHNIILVGPPGVGKTMLAGFVRYLLPPLYEEESLEVTKIYSALGMQTNNYGIVNQRPFRSPHHTATYLSIVGGGVSPIPGEISLAHRGVLFLDELCEFPRQVLESLRQPVEQGFINISRSKFKLTFPSKFILLACSNPCPCGYYNVPKHNCTCSPNHVSSYKKRLSGPLLDRIDLQLFIGPVTKSLSIYPDTSSVEDMKKAVQTARNIQKSRFKTDGIYTNSEMSNLLIQKYCKLDSSALGMLTEANVKYEFSVRTYYKIIKVSQTIADLDGSIDIKVNHVAEALIYRDKYYSI